MLDLVLVLGTHKILFSSDFFLFIFIFLIGREFMNNGKLAAFMLANPHVTVKTYIRGGGHPYIECVHCIYFFNLLIFKLVVKLKSNLFFH